MTNDTTRPRLQLSLGALALLGEELPSLGGKRVFEAACRDTGVELLVTLHAASPEGPGAQLVRDRVRRVQNLAHPSLVVPLAVGDMDGRPWVVEPVLTMPSALQRLNDGGALGLRQGIVALRAVTRGIASVHRAGQAHGALDLEAVYLTPGDVRINGFATTVSTSARADLDALGPLAWAFFTGDLPDGSTTQLSTRRRGIPDGLDLLVSSLLDPDPARRPARAEVVLDALDAFPASQPSQISSFLEGAGRGTRTPRAREAVVLMVIVGLSVLVSSLVLGQ